MTHPKHYLGVQQIAGHDLIAVKHMLDNASNEQARNSRGASRPLSASSIAIVDVPGLGPCVVVTAPQDAPRAVPAPEPAGDRPEPAQARTAGPTPRLLERVRP